MISVLSFLNFTLSMFSFFYFRADPALQGI